MSLALMLAAASLAGATSPPRPLAPICQKVSLGTIAGATPARIQPLGDQPPARHIKAVLRTTPDGCITPIVVRAEVGQKR